MKPLQLFDSTGRPVPLGEEIASGGEGMIYAVPALNGFVAKVYRECLTPEKRSKLLAMVKGCDEPLKKIAAWPAATLHNAGTQVCGFLMPKVSGSRPIHDLYSPGWRKQHYPALTWEFLAHVARNTAAAFQVVHAHGHVIGDVNPNLVFADMKSGVVKLIDCDSFHITIKGNRYPCEVGMLEFTPPELQSYSSFRGIPRTANQDNFGLAVLIFHLLLMGRHPFSGVFSGDNSLTLKNWIEQFRYAFGRNAAEKQMAPPPKSVTPSILPDEIAQFFERAFTELGVQHEGRPSAQEWVSALESMKKELRTCECEKNHIYFRGLSFCPWCQQEKENVSMFFIHPKKYKIDDFDIEKIWSEILTIKPPATLPTISISYRNMASMQKTTWLKKKMERFSGRRKLKQHALDNVLIKFQTERKLLENSGRDVEFYSKFNKLFDHKKDGLFLQQKFSDKMRIIESEMNLCFHDFLKQFPVDKENIEQISFRKIKILATHGIVTAADLEQNTSNIWQIAKKSQFTQDLTKALFQWIYDLRSRFISLSSQEMEIKELIKRYGYIKQLLLAGPTQLTQLKMQILQRRKELLPIVEEAARQVAQAQADLDALG